MCLSVPPDNAKRLMYRSAGLLSNELICKRLYKRGKEVILLSEHPRYPARH